MSAQAELRRRLERLPVLKGPLAVLLRRLERVDPEQMSEGELVEQGAKARVGERDMQVILVAFRTFRGASWAPGLTGLYTIEQVVHRLCCTKKGCAACAEMTRRTAVDPELRERFARAARQVVGVLP